jgi:hypothetical protein
VSVWGVVAQVPERVRIPSATPFLSIGKTSFRPRQGKIGRCIQFPPPELRMTKKTFNQALTVFQNLV